MTVRFISDTFTRHLFWLLSGALLVVAAGWWLYSAHQLNDVLTEQTSLRAQVQSQQLAQMPSLISAVEKKDALQVSHLIEHFKKVSDADFITVSDAQGIRLAHPVSERIGLPVMGGDIDGALQYGKSYLSYASGSLGPSVRYISPIFGSQGDIIGMVKVGYLLDTLHSWTNHQLVGLILFGLFILLVSVALAVRFSTYVNKNMQHMEPWQLKQALVTKQGVLQATHEGLLAVDENQEVYVANDSAKKLLGISSDNSSTHLADWVDSLEHFNLSGEDFLDRLVRINGQHCIITRVTIPTEDNGAKAAVFSLRAYAELQALSDNLSQVGQYIESLRVTRHEYQNKLSILAGLLQQEQYEQALHVVLNQARTDQQVLDQLKPFRKFPQLSALLLAKLLKAKERQIDLSIPNEERWQQCPPYLAEDQLCAIAGNLVDNSMEAVKEHHSPQVIFDMWESAEELVLSVTNNGPEITASLEELTTLGYTTKNDVVDHGIGLYMIQSMVESANGHIEMDSDAVETSFTLYFPKLEQTEC